MGHGGGVGSGQPLSDPFTVRTCILSCLVLLHEDLVVQDTRASEGWQASTALTSIITLRCLYGSAGSGRLPGHSAGRVVHVCRAAAGAEPVPCPVLQLLLRHQPHIVHLSASAMAPALMESPPPVVLCSSLTASAAVQCMPTAAVLQTGYLSVDRIVESGTILLCTNLHFCSR